MRIKSTRFAGLKVIQNNNIKDRRGLFRENYKKQFLNNKSFIFGCLSISKKNVIRGLHLQTKFPQEKYVSVLKGAILDVAVDLRKKSKTFGKHFKVILSKNNAKSIFIPAGFAHGFLGLENENIIYYTNTNYRSKKHEVGLLWNDQDLKIKWPLKKPILSTKDKRNIKFKEFEKLYL